MIRAEQKTWAAQKGKSSWTTATVKPAQSDMGRTLLYYNCIKVWQLKFLWGRQWTGQDELLLLSVLYKFIVCFCCWWYALLYSCWVCVSCVMLWASPLCCM